MKKNDNSSQLNGAFPNDMLLWLVYFKTWELEENIFIKLLSRVGYNWVGELHVIKIIPIRQST